MLSNEERNRLVETYKKFPDAIKVAEIYSVSPSSAYRLVRRMKDTGSVALKVGVRGRKPSLSPEDVEKIRRAVLDASYRGSTDAPLQFRSYADVPSRIQSRPQSN